MKILRRRAEADARIAAQEREIQQDEPACFIKIALSVTPSAKAGMDKPITMMSTRTSDNALFTVYTLPEL